MRLQELGTVVLMSSRVGKRSADPSDTIAGQGVFYASKLGKAEFHFKDTAGLSVTGTTATIEGDEFDVVMITC